jgi:hypothetical protein
MSVNSTESTLQKTQITTAKKLLTMDNGVELFTYKWTGGDLNPV